LFITSESSIGSNLRRVEALTGLSAYAHLVDIRSDLDRAGRLLKVSAHDVPGRVESLLERVDTLEHELDTIRSQRRGELAGELAAGAERIADLNLVVAAAPDLDPNSLRQLALGIRDRLVGGSVIVVGAVHGGKGSLVGLVTKDLVAAGVSAAEVIADAAKELGGGGSRDPELAQAGGPHGQNLDVALDVAGETARRQLGSL
jgi:alanyl-tRNA synthetase